MCPRLWMIVLWDVGAAVLAGFYRLLFFLFSVLAFIRLSVCFVFNARCVAGCTVLNNLPHWSVCQRSSMLLLYDLSAVVCCSFRQRSADISLKTPSSDSHSHWSGRNVQQMCANKWKWFCFEKSWSRHNWVLTLAANSNVTNKKCCKLLP